MAHDHTGYQALTFPVSQVGSQGIADHVFVPTISTNLLFVYCVVSSLSFCHKQVIRLESILKFFFPRFFYYIENIYCPFNQILLLPFVQPRHASQGKPTGSTDLSFCPKQGKCFRIPACRSPHRIPDNMV